LLQQQHHQVDIVHGVVGVARSVKEVEEPARENSNYNEQSRQDVPQKILSLVSQYRISTGGVSEACSPERPCTQSLEWGRLESITTKELGRE
jgi:hypothetical protein